MPEISVVDHAGRDMFVKNSRREHGRVNALAVEYHGEVLDLLEGCKSGLSELSTSNSPLSLELR
jgi:hypothetical protein